jgi:hypothetical protein
MTPVGAEIASEDSLKNLDAFAGTSIERPRSTNTIMFSKLEIFRDG